VIAIAVCTNDVYSKKGANLAPTSNKRITNEISANLICALQLAATDRSLPAVANMPQNG
jgi:hypothetical protein